MRFNSVKRGNFSGLASSVNKNADAIFNAARKSSVDHTAIAKESIKGRSMERRAAMEAEGKVAQAGLKAVAKVSTFTDAANVIESEGKAKGKKARMAGVLGGLGALATGVVTKKYLDRQEERDNKRDAEMQAWREKIESAYSQPLPEPPKMEYPNFENPGLVTPSAPSGEVSQTNTGGGSASSTVPTTYQSKPLAGSMDLSKLTGDDFNHLAYAISSEAGPGKDRYGVAASILNRVASDKWPGTVKDVIYQPGQYEGVYKGLSVDSPGIAADLSSEKGRGEILKALEVLDGRTDFKGQSMLKYRSNKGNKGGMMDPMFDPQGNFFHYSHQT